MIRAALVFEPLHARHDRLHFRCGEEALERYLRVQAGQDAVRHVASVIVAVDPHGLLAGFYTLAMSAVKLTDVPEPAARKLPRYPLVPAVRLGRLAVATELQGQGLGGVLLADALSRALSNPVAWAVVAVDTKDERAAGFYRRFGFVALRDDPRHLFLWRGTIEKLLMR